MRGLLSRRSFVVLGGGLLAAGCVRSRGPRPPGERTQVVVMGMIHGGHRSSERYSIAVIQRLIRGIDPDHVLTEIPPDRFETAVRQFAGDGRITEPRLQAFPEYTDALFPLQRELGFEIVPCSAWTREMADGRAARQEQLKRTDPGAMARVEAARREMNRRLGDGHAADDPAWIHTPEYDAIVREGMEPASAVSDRVGEGGWDNINRAHLALIQGALDARVGPGKRILIMFGAWHKHRILDMVRRRADVEVVSVRGFL